MGNLSDPVGTPFHPFSSSVLISSFVAIGLKLIIDDDNKRVPDVKFDTRCIMKELAEKPQLTRALFTGCRPLLEQLA